MGGDCPGKTGIFLRETRRSWAQGSRPEFHRFLSEVRHQAWGSTPRNGKKLPEIDKSIDY
jgi:hypothetical protein